MAYAPGDTVVHPHHGAAVVTGVLQKDVGGGPVEYLELFVEHASLKIMVPSQSVARVGIRDVSTKKEAEAVLAVLDHEADVHERWTERNSVTVARMKSAGLRDLAMVVRDLIRHSERTGKPLSSHETASRDTCIDLLARELSLSLGMSQDEAATLIVERSQAAPAQQHG